MTRVNVLSKNTNWVWLSVWGLPNGNYHFSLLRRMRPQKGVSPSNMRRLSPYGLISSVQYRDILLLMYHADFLLDFSTRLVTEVEEFGLKTTKHYDDLNAAYFAVLHRDLFDAGGISFPVFPIVSDREHLKRKYELCLAKQARKTRFHPEREGVPKSIDALWREFNSFDFAGGGNHLETK